MYYNQTTTTMTKKEFKERVDVHKYTGAGRDYNLTAVFFDWKSGTTDDHKRFCGYKYCVNTYTKNITQKELIDLLYGIVTGKITENNVPYFVQVDIAQTDDKRFKVPIGGSGLNYLT